MESALFAIMLVTVVYACFYAIREDDLDIASKSDSEATSEPKE